jgi:hypothetical protein
MSKVTPWFPAKTKPAKPGAYEVRCTRSEAFMPGETRVWDGAHWLRQGFFVFGTFCECDQWRGLAKKP